MNHRSQRQKVRETILWKRILERHKFRGRLLPTRVPLVFLRLRSLKESPPRGTRSQRSGSPVQLNLHFQLSWPQWLVTRHEPSVAFHTSTFNSTIIRELKWLLTDLKTINVPASPLSKTISQLTERVERNFERIQPGAQQPTKRFETPRPRDGVAVNPAADERAASTPASGPKSLPSERNLRKAAPVFPLPATSVNNRRLMSDSSKNVWHIQSRYNLPLTSSYYFSTKRDVFTSHAPSTISAVQRVQPTAPARKFTADAFSTTVVQRSLRHDAVDRALRVNVETRSVANVTVQPQLVHRARTDENASNSSAPARSQLYTQPAKLTFANQMAAGGSAARTQSHEEEPPTPARTPSTVVQPLQPQLDMNRLSDEVYRHIQRKIRIERERHGL